jgi:hypothetical protein
MSLTPAEESQIAMYNSGLLPIGTTASGPATTPFAQTFDRRLAVSSLFTPTTQTLTITAIWLPAGRTVTGITFVSVGAESGGSNLWFALYKGNSSWNPVSFTLMAQGTTEGGAAAFAANSAHRQALTTPQVCPYSGLYYLAFMCQASGMPTLLNLTAGSVNAVGSTNAAQMGPNLAATADGSLTTTAPTTMGSQTAITQCLYAYVD